MDEFNSSSLQWSVPSNITGDTKLNYCDYYQAGYGYEFSYFDNGIGYCVLDDRRQGATNEKYMDMSVYSALNVDWSEL